ncbi:hypothetical protein HELRODRAFT_160668 [Helobdella robusta]|uniref:Coiled-coil domain-containing protein 12 n=1 Tax=Helobdella robusta TaxID=6412 RepID=T1EQK9_HELRO|nr:hypothetical protein HELRODRAFT_160668 [Helobdella robusta]ESO06492.1 hypothetical protein HELRODRAFT_160668 [Helobdella robusta]
MKSLSVYDYRQQTIAFLICIARNGSVLIYSLYPPMALFSQFLLLPLNEVKEQVKDQLIDAQQTNIVEEVDLLNLAPRKPDWDLKRDVAKKLEKLERRTQRAMGELIRDRLKSCEMKSEEVAASLYLTT